MRINRSMIMLLGFAVCSSAIGQAAYAGFSSNDSVTMAGQPVFEMRGSADGYSPDHRAWMAQDALDNSLVLATDRSPAAVTTGRDNGAIVVMLGGRKVATADANSAAMENITPEALADKWAQGIKDFLSDSARTEQYVATLIGPHTVQSSIALVERTLFVPAGFTFPITLTSDISSDTAKAGDSVQATVKQDIPMGRYVIPAGSLLIGELYDGTGSDLSIRFNTIRTLNGTELPINAIVTDDYLVSSDGPHRVCTYAIPSGMANGIPQEAGRVPAFVGVGTISGAGRHLLVFHSGMGVISASRPLNLVFETVTPVAVVIRPSGM